MPQIDPSRFGMMPRGDVPRSAFDVQHSHKTTFNAGALIPVYIEEVLPGDSHRLNMTLFARLSTPLVPVMDNLYLESFFFFVPNRLVWSNWERFMGEQAGPGDTTDFQVPYIAVDGPDAGVATIYDYFGITFNDLPITTAPQINALPFRAYNRIWYDWFRDQDIDTVIPSMPVDDGPDAANLYVLLHRRKRHDYFTSARPWMAKPIQQSAVWSQQPYVPGGNMTFPQETAYGVGVPVSGLGVTTGATPTAGAVSAFQSGNRTESFDPRYTTGSTAFLMRVGLADAPDVRVMVNDLRTAVMVQRWMEINARGGTRYAEIVQKHFGVHPQDARLQRPEYLGGGRSMITVNPIAQTSASGVAGTTTVLGEQAGIGSVVARHGFSQSFSEHGYVIGLVNVRADQTYQQGIEKLWKRRTQFDFYWPSLAHLGEQAILRQELYSTGDVNDVLVFGYQERYSEYKWKASRTSGYFRSTNGTPLDMWHFGQEFATPPTLNLEFITEAPPVQRVLQSSTNFGQDFLCDMLFDVRMTRAMPMFSIPGVGARL